MSNTFSYKKVWTDNFQKSNWAMPIYPVIADLQFSAGLKMGDTINRRYRSNPIVANNLGTDGSYSIQNYAEANETFTISKQKEATVRIVNTEVLMTDLPTTESYGAQLSNAIYQAIDGDTLDACRSGAGQTIDDGTFGGTAGNGLAVSLSNIANIPVLAMEKFMGANVRYSNNMKFGQLPYEDYGGMLTWVIPPQVWTTIQTYMIARITVNGDNVVTNGYVGNFGQFQTFVSNNLAFTATLALSVQPTDGDTVTIKGVPFTFKTTLSTGPAVPGEVLIGGSASAANTNLAAAINAPTTTTANFTGFTSANTLSANNFTTPYSVVLNGVSATATSTSTAIVAKASGKITVAQSMTSGSNLWTTAKQNLHSIFMVAKNVSLAIRKDPEIYENFVSGAIAKDYTMWTVYDNKVFRDQARAIIDLVIDCSNAAFSAYSNIRA